MARVVAGVVEVLEDILEVGREVALERVENLDLYMKFCFLKVLRAWRMQRKSYDD
jgi:hypothetical protein